MGTQRNWTGVDARARAAPAQDDAARVRVGTVSGSAVSPQMTLPVGFEAALENEQPPRVASAPPPGQFRKKVEFGRGASLLGVATGEDIWSAASERIGGSGEDAGKNSMYASTIWGCPGFCSVPSPGRVSGSNDAQYSDPGELSMPNQMSSDRLASWKVASGSHQLGGNTRRDEMLRGYGSQTDPLRGPRVLQRDWTEKDQTTLERFSNLSIQSAPPLRRAPTQWTFQSRPEQADWWRAQQSALSAGSESGSAAFQSDLRTATPQGWGVAPCPRVWQPAACCSSPSEQQPLAGPLTCTGRTTPSAAEGAYSRLWAPIPHRTISEIARSDVARTPSPAFESSSVVSSPVRARSASQYSSVSGLEGGSVVSGRAFGSSRSAWSGPVSGAASWKSCEDAWDQQRATTALSGINTLNGYARSPRAPVSASSVSSSSSSLPMANNPSIVASDPSLMRWAGGCGASPLYNASAAYQSAQSGTVCTRSWSSPATVQAPNSGYPAVLNHQPRAPKERSADDRQICTGKKGDGLDTNGNEEHEQRVPNRRERAASSPGYVGHVTNGKSQNSEESSCGRRDAAARLESTLQWASRPPLNIPVTESQPSPETCVQEQRTARCCLESPADGVSEPDNQCRVDSQLIGSGTTSVSETGRPLIDPNANRTHRLSPSRQSSLVEGTFEHYECHNGRRLCPGYSATSPRPLQVANAAGAHFSQALPLISPSPGATQPLEESIWIHPDQIVLNGSEQAGLCTEMELADRRATPVYSWHPAAQLPSGIACPQGRAASFRKESPLVASGSEDANESSMFSLVPDHCVSFPPVIPSGCRFVCAHATEDAMRMRSAKHGNLADASIPESCLSAEPAAYGAQTTSPRPSSASSSSFVSEENGGRPAVPGSVGPAGANPIAAAAAAARAPRREPTTQMGHSSGVAQLRAPFVSVAPILTDSYSGQVRVGGFLQTAAAPPATVPPTGAPPRSPLHFPSLDLGTSGTLSSPDAANPPNSGVIASVGRSALLERFRTALLASDEAFTSWKLEDIRGQIVEFSTDQHGSRFIQTKLETATPDQVGWVLQEVLAEMNRLVTDVFGNYVVQKLLEHGTARDLQAIAMKLKNRILALSLHMYGCRAVQKALEVLPASTQAELVIELDGHVLKCIRDQNGNHVIQKCIERVPGQHVQFIVDAVRGQAVSLAEHSYGCRVIQRILEYSPEEQKVPIMREIMQACRTLIRDQYGNYVIQHVVEHGKEEERAHILRMVRDQCISMSQHKYASNVVERCLQHGSPADRKALIDILLGRSDVGGSGSGGGGSSGATALPRNSVPLIDLVQDQFGNYVVQRVLDVAGDEQRQQAAELLRANLNVIKRFSYGKHILARLESTGAAAMAPTFANREGAPGGAHPCVQNLQNTGKRAPAQRLQLEPSSNCSSASNSSSSSATTTSSASSTWNLRTASIASPSKRRGRATGCFSSEVLELEASMKKRSEGVTAGGFPQASPASATATATAATAERNPRAAGRARRQTHTR